MQSSMLRHITEDLGNGGTIDGDLTISGDLTVSGGGSLSFDEILEGTQVIDVTSTEALLVRKNSDGGDVFIVDTTNNDVTVGSSSLADSTLIIESSSSGDPKLKFTATSNRSALIDFIEGSTLQGAIVYKHNGDTLGFSTGSTNRTERFVVNETSSYFTSNVLVGLTTADTLLDAGITPALQVEGTTSSGSSLSLFRNDNGISGPYLILGKSRGTSIGSDTVVQDNDHLGTLAFVGADGTDRVTPGARIFARVNGTPGSNDLPTELVFSTTADGASATTERMRIESDGTVKIVQATANAALSIDHDANHNAISIDAENTTDSTIYVESDALTTGRALWVKSDSSSTGTRNLVEFHNDNASANMTTALKIQQDAPHNALVVNAANTTDWAVDIQGTAHTTAGVLYAYSNSSDTGTRDVAHIHNDHASATGATGLRVIQDSSGYGMHISNPTNTTNFGNGLIIASQDENNTSFPLFIKTNSSDADETAGNTRFVVRADGRVGIGTSSPDGKLHVHTATSGTFGPASYADDLTIENNADGGLTIATPDANSGYIAFSSPTTNGAYNALIHSSYSSNAEYLAFNTQSGGEVMRLTHQGRVGINATSPDTLMELEEVSGNPELTLSMYSATWNHRPVITLRRTKDTSTSTLADTANEDYLGEIRFQGVNQSDAFVDSAAITARADDTPDSDAQAGRLEFTVSSSAGSGADKKPLILDAYSRISLSNNDSGTQNTVFGKDAGLNIDAGTNYNVFIGHETAAGGTLDDATNNTAVGYATLNTLTQGDNNTALGANALQNVTTGSSNVAIGQAALDALTTGGSNVAIGRNAGGAMGVAENANILIGFAAGGSLDEGTNGSIDDNIAIGLDALVGGNLNTASTAVNRNIAIGTNAMNSTGTNAQTGTIAIGYDALTALTSGTNNTVVGYQAADAMTSANYNTAFGYQALSAETIGHAATAFGDRALGLQNKASDANTRNTGVGFFAGYNNVTGTDNTYLGFEAGKGGTGNNTGNTALGSLALNAVTSGGSNVALGKESLTSLTDGEKNIAIGYDAGKAITSANRNIAIGYEALRTEDVDGDRTTAVGYQALYSQNGTTEAMANTGLGYNTGYYNVTGTNNTHVGYQAGVGTSGQSGSNITAVGSQALKIAYGQGNTALGQRSGVALTSGVRNILIGVDAGATATTSSNLVLIGTFAGDAINNVGADGTVAVGRDALTALTSGARNTAVGYETGGRTTTGADNTYIGYQAGDDTRDDSKQNTVVGSLAFAATHTTADADDCVAIGYSALGGVLQHADVAGTVAVGSSALTALTTGAQNVAIGYQSLTNCTTGKRNTSVGYQTLSANMNVGDNNTAVGYASLYTYNPAADDEGDNTAVGAFSGYYITTGEDNTCIGYAAGATGSNNLTTGDGNTIIGHNAALNDSARTNVTVIGAGAISSGDNTVAIGNASVTDVYMAHDSGALVHCAGIQFPATQVTNGGANVLDDYEEGNFTVTVSGDASGAFSAEEGEYVKIGKVVHFRIVINVSSNFAANTIAGLPFACTQSGSPSSLVGGIAVLTSNANDEPITASVSTGGSTLSFYSGSDATDTHLPNTTNDVYRLEGTYFAA